MSFRLRTLFLKTPIKIALGLVAAWFLFAWFGFEPLLKWAAPKYIADKSRHALSLEAAKFDPLRLSLELKGLKLSEPDGKPLLAFDELFIDFAAASLFNRAWTFDDIRLLAPNARVELRADGSLNWSALIEALKSKEEDTDEPLPRLLIRRIALERGRLAWADQRVGYETTLIPLDLTLTDLSTLPDDKGAYTLAATTRMGARLRWKGDMTLQPVAASGEIGVDNLAPARFWPYLDAKLNLAPPAGTATLTANYHLAYADKRLSLLLDKIDLNLDGLVLRGRGAARDTLALDKLTLSGGHFDLEKRQLDLGKIALSGGKVALRRDSAGRLDVMDWFPAPGGEPETTAKAKVAPPSPWRVNLANLSLNSLAVQFTDAGFVTPLDAEIGNLQLGFAAHAEVGGAQTRATLEELAVSLSGIRLASGSKPLLVLGGLNLEGGNLDLATRAVRVGKVSLANGRIDAVRDAKGRIALLDAFKPVAAKPLPARRGTNNEAPGWRYQVDQVGLSGFQFGLRDETVRPVGGLTLQDIEATARGFSENLNQSLPVTLGFRVKEGGRFQAEGKVIPERLRADIKLKLDGLALAPAQPWLAQAANLTLLSGRASSQGRVRFDGKAASARQLDFKGGFVVDDLLLKESETGDRFLAWKRLSSDTVSATAVGLAIEELKLDGLGAKLIIYQDKSVNLKKIFRTTSPGEGATVDASKSSAKTHPTSLTPGPSPGGSGEKTFRLDIDRVRVEHGEVDFADLSLALPFGTRIRDFKGALNGISSQPGAVAELELDGRVDEYGLARVVGQVDLFDPTGFMDIKTVFRNVEMVNLTPYTATFVGRKIESGKLSLDLEYKIIKRQLLGENKIIMDKLTLGERIQSSTAKDLPLDLAIAILQDSDGRIDLGLPVSGSLDDPQFSYGRIIWKAIGNILTKIVTAPFRALAGLFGGDGEKLEKIAFEAGEPGLTPPEKEKFKQIATILGKRPGLALGVHGAWSATIDRPVLKERQLRRAVLERMGVKLAADEDAGPISTTNTKARTALELLYASRFGEQDWKTLQTRWLQANPEKAREAGMGRMLSRLQGLPKTEAPLAEADGNALKGSDLYAMLYARLLEQESVGDDALRQLAERRTRAIIEGLVQAGAPRERLQAAAISDYQGEGKEVPVKLELGVAGKR
ncbi:MAG: DUF748 domain-containing protein [Pseudomonadota bacterium]|nr:DUF748 domain-containing protein [Pseudomonadota bacterium]MDP1904880.1 DUF748 domain-containing protein [Pseudomonadota bacterium]MDP2353409.1 DUF748 domain-containing protein [Pseudomonadota bacterium]